MTLQEVRSYFPYLAEGKIYFNHASIGPLSTKVMGALNNYFHERSVTKVNNLDTLLDSALKAKKNLAVMLNGSPKGIAWQQNVSSGLNLLARSLKWKTGDRILLNDIEFPSNIYPFMNLKKEGVEIDMAKAEEGVVDVDKIVSKITPRTRLISVSAVQFLSGYRINLKELSEICRQKNILLCVDGIQAGGQVEIDVSYIDYFAGGTHKWLMAMQGLGYIHVSEYLRERLAPAYAGWLSVKDPWNILDYNLEFIEGADKFQTGTFNIAGLSALNGSFELFNEFGFDNVYNKVKGNTLYLRKKLEEKGIRPLLHGVPEENLSGIVTFPHKDAEKIVKELEERNIDVTMREGLVRLSPHYYNTKDETDIVIETLGEIIGV